MIDDPHAQEEGAPDRLAEARRLVELIAARCVNEGFDLVASTTIGAYDRIVPEGFRLGLPWPDDSLLVLVGNTRAAWPHFVAAAQHPPLRDHPHPFDTWTVDRLGSALAPAFVHPHDLRFAFAGPPRNFSALHLAQASGLAFRGPASLAVHPQFGPWFGLRAALSVKLSWHDAAPPEPVCVTCSAPCKPALDAAIRSTRAGGHPVRDHWRHWLAVRDACPVGRDARYPDPQIRWHYAHDRSALKAP